MFLLRLAALAVLLAAVGGCAPGEATASVETAPGAASTSRRGDLQGLVVLTGELQAVRSEKIHVPRTPTWQMPIRWLEEDGARVKEGQRVLELDNSQFTGELAQKELAESQAVNQLSRKRADVAVDLSEKEFAVEEGRIKLEKARIQAAIPAELRSMREFQDDQLALARAEVDHAKAIEDLDAARESSEAELEELRIALRKAREEVTTAREAIEALTLTAPRDGILVVAENPREGRKFQVGDNVWVGLAVMRIPDLTAMKVVAQLSDVDDGSIAPGLPVRCTLDIDPDREYGGSIQEISPVAQEEGEQSLRRSFRVIILLDESAPERMRPGMSVRAEVLQHPREDAVLVPRESLEWSDGSVRALLGDGSAVEIGLGPCNAQECVVEEGLDAGVLLRRRG